MGQQLPLRCDLGIVRLAGWLIGWLVCVQAEEGGSQGLRGAGGGHAAGYPLLTALAEGSSWAPIQDASGSGSPATSDAVPASLKIGSGSTGAARQSQPSSSGSAGEGSCVGGGGGVDTAGCTQEPLPALPQLAVRMTYHHGFDGEPPKDLEQMCASGNEPSLAGDKHHSSGPAGAA